MVSHGTIGTLQYLHIAAATCKKIGIRKEKPFYCGFAGTDQLHELEVCKIGSIVPEGGMLIEGLPKLGKSPAFHDPDLALRDVTPCDALQQFQRGCASGDFIITRFKRRRHTH